jgi:hypothetical protein
MIEQLKAQLVLLTGVTRDALHTQLGLFIFFMVALMFGKRAGSPIPILAVLSAALLSEVFDRLRDLSDYGVWDWRESIHDVINTVFWPAVIVALVKSGRIFSRQ